MKVLSVTMENYGAFYGEHRFHYADRGLTMVLGENLDEPRMNSNGSAKSTLFEVLDWCWYGKVPRGDHADSIINEESKACSATTFLEDDDGTPAVIKRSRPSALQFWLNGEEQTFLDTDKTQEAIEKFLGMDRDVFHSSVFFAQTELMHFADVGDAKRIEILSKIIPELATVDVLSEKAKLLRASASAKVESAQHQLANVQGQLQGLGGIDFSEKTAQWEAQRKADHDSTNHRMRELEAYVQTHQSDAAALPALDAELSKLATSQMFPRPNHGTALMEAEQRVLQLHSAHSVAHAEVTRLRNAIQRIVQTAVGVCSQCGQQVTKDHLGRESAAMQAQLNDASRVEGESHQAWVAAQRPVADLKAAQAQADLDWQNAERARGAEITRLNQQVAGLRQLQNYLDNARNEFNGCVAKLQSIASAVNPFLEEARKLEERRTELRWEVEGATDAVKKADDALAYADYWVKAFGPKGLKNYILDSKLQEMTDAANHWVKVLTGGTFWVRFETQKQGRSTKKLSNELNIRVFRYNPDGRISERNYKSWSGGEKKRVSLAIDFGLSRLVARRAAKRYDLLVLDELFKHVDSAGGEAIAEMLEELKREKSSIFVIEHDGDFQSRFENRVVVRRKNARSTIVELSNEQGIQDDGPETPRAPTPLRKKKPKRTPILSGVSG